MNPAALMAACETNFAEIKMLLAWEEDAGQRKLVGVWALQLRKVAPFWPAVLEALPYNYAFLSSPVVDPAFTNEVIPAFFAAIEKNPLLPKVVSLKSLDAECPSYPAMLKALAGRGIQPLMLCESARPCDPGIWRETLRLNPQKAAAGLEQIVGARHGRRCERQSACRRPAGI